MKKRKVDNNDIKTCLCDDMISNILVRVPVRSLIRFTSVCKSWNSLIRSPAFVSAYNNRLIPRRQRYLLYTSNEARSSCPPFLTFTCAGKPRYTLKRMPLDDFRVVGCCEGLVCVKTNDDIGQVYLWNPLLQTFKILPPSPSQKTTNQYYFVYGLGYSYTSNDHRVVKINYRNKVEIYSLKSDSWRCIDSTAPVVASMITSVFTNGHVNWFAYARLPARPIMWFDVDEESFGVKDLLHDRWVPNYEEWSQRLDVNKLLRIPNDCEVEHGSLWKIKALACENSRVEILLKNWLGVHARLDYFDIFDGESFLQTTSNSLMNLLGLNDMAPLEKRDASMVQGFHVFCLAESLMLINNPVLECE